LLRIVLGGSLVHRKFVPLILLPKGWSLRLTRLAWDLRLLLRHLVCLVWSTHEAILDELLALIDLRRKLAARLLVDEITCCVNTLANFVGVLLGEFFGLIKYSHGATSW